MIIIKDLKNSRDVKNGSEYIGKKRESTITLIHLKVLHMVKIKFFYALFLLK